MTTGAKKQLVGSLIESGSETRQVQIIADEVLGDEIIETFADGDTTPSVAVPNTTFKTANTGATTITDLDDGRSGQVVIVVFGDANTTVDFTASGLIGNGGADWTPAANEQMTCTYDGTDWYCSVPTAAGGAEVNDLTAAVTWANVPDANITQSSVTQHEAAFTIVEGQITGANFSNWDTAFSWGDHSGTYLPLSGGTLTGGLTIDDDAAAIDLTLGDGAGADGDILLKLNIDRAWQFRQGGSGASTNLRLQSLVASKIFYITDDLNVQRFSFNPTSGAFTITGNISGTTIGGITEANLLDKTATETVSGAYTFSATAAPINISGVTDGNDIISLPNTAAMVRMTDQGGFKLYADSSVMLFGGDNHAALETGLGIVAGTTTEDVILGSDGGVRMFSNMQTSYATAYTAGLFSDGTFRFYNQGKTDYLAISHNGTDAAIAGVNTIDLNITGLTAINAGTVDADFDALTATSLFTDANVQVGEGLYMKERASGDSDIATYGQLYTKNSTQQELYFVTEDGVEHHVAGGSISETFGVVKNGLESVTSSTTLQNDDDLAISVLSGEVYHWTCLLLLSRVTDATNCGFKWDFSVPGGSTGTYQWTEIEDGDSAFGTIGASLSLTADQTLSTLPAGSGRVILRMEGVLDSGADGTFQLRWAQNTSSVGDARCHSGSALMLIR